MKLFDTHCHLAHAELRTEALSLVQRARASQVLGFAIVSADRDSLQKAPALVQTIKIQHPQCTVAWTAGVHPHDAKEIDDGLWNEIAAAAVLADAVGETGLDYHYEHSERPLQLEYFNRHIELACALRKPLVIHCREASADIFNCLSTAALRQHPNPGILHCFTEDKDTAHKLLDLGFYLSFSGILTFKNAEALRNVAKDVPLDRLLIETDSPWLAPIPMRGKQNEPAFVAHTFDFMSQLRSEKREELAAQLWKNSCRVYGLPDQSP